MACSGCRWSIFVLWLLGAAMPGQVIAGEAWQRQIADLESRLFDPILSPAEVDRLLAALEHAESRPEAARRLAELGQGHVDRVIAFARHCPDMEARQACTEVVETLDAAYRTTELGERLGALYREHAEALLPAYWARFRNDPLDPRAVAMLMHADAAATYAALGRTGDRHDPLRYLLLRLRELSPDEFAQERIYEHTEGGARLVMADVFPTAGYRRIVGQVGLMRMKVGRSHVPGAGLPKIGYLSVHKRSVFIYAHPAPRLKDLSLQAAILVDTRHGYNPKEIRHTSTRRDLGPVPEQIFLLP